MVLSQALCFNENKITLPQIHSKAFVLLVAVGQKTDKKVQTQSGMQIVHESTVIYSHGSVER